MFICSSKLEKSVEAQKRRAVKTLGHRIIAAHRSCTVSTVTVLVAAVVPTMPTEFCLDQVGELALKSTTFVATLLST